MADDSYIIPVKTNSS
jgi:hypothetical protein